MSEYEAKIETHLSNAVMHEAAGNLVEAEKSFKFAAFYEARRLELDTKEYIASCCPAY